MDRTDVILVDACVIIEAHRVGVWNMMRNNLNLATVETCIVEAQTGKANRLDSTILDNELRSSFSSIHQVTQLEIAEFYAANECDLPVIDEGELELWIHACQREDVWFLCGPDRASMKYGYQLGHVDQLVSMERVLNMVGIKKAEIKGHYNEKWLSDLKTNLRMGIL